MAFFTYGKAGAGMIMLAAVLSWAVSLYGVWHVFHRHSQRMHLWAANIALTFPFYPIVGQYLLPVEKLHGIASKLI